MTLLALLLLALGIFAGAVGLFGGYLLAVALWLKIKRWWRG